MPGRKMRACEGVRGEVSFRDSMNSMYKSFVCRNYTLIYMYFGEINKEVSKLSKSLFLEEIDNYF